MGKSTTSMATFNSELWTYQKVTLRSSIIDDSPWIFSRIQIASCFSPQPSPVAGHNPIVWGMQVWESSEEGQLSPAGPWCLAMSWKNMWPHAVAVGPSGRTGHVWPGTAMNAWKRKKHGWCKKQERASNNQNDQNVWVNYSDRTLFSRTLGIVGFYRGIIPFYGRTIITIQVTESL